MRLNLTSELQMKKGTSAVVFLLPVREKENVRPLLMLGEISKPRMDTDH